jgi:peptidoglycan/LPS O-acetylase OafA/YrhL
VGVVTRVAQRRFQKAHIGHIFRYVRDDAPDPTGPSAPRGASRGGARGAPVAADPPATALPATALPATGHAAAVPGAPAGSGRTARMPGLDALRGLAVALVLLNHAAPGTFGAAGVLGVTIFFALSGWLITGVLMRDLERHGRIRFGTFYAARALRLFPPLLLMLTGYVVVEGAFDLLGEAHLVPESLVAALTYTINVPGLPHGSESLYHFWTLATEEQFYLVWPLVLAWGWRRGLLRGAVGFSVAGTLVACMLTLLLVSPDAARVYALPTSWGAALLIGCAGYLGRDALVRMLPATAGARRAIQVGIVVAFAAATLLTGIASHTSWYVLGVPAVACASVVLISYSGRWRALPTRWLRPAVALGTVSYAAYLWNGAIVRWISPDDLLETLAVVVLTLLAATASWWLVERPVARWRARRAVRGRPAGAERSAAPVA